MSRINQQMQWRRQQIRDPRNSNNEWSITQTSQTSPVYPDKSGPWHNTFEHVRWHSQWQTSGTSWQMVVIWFVTSVSMLEKKTNKETKNLSISLSHCSRLMDVHITQQVQYHTASILYQPLMTVSPLDSRSFNESSVASSVWNLGLKARGCVSRRAGITCK